MSTPTPAPDANAFLMGGGGAPSASFPTPGTTVTGRITTRPTTEQQRDLQTGKPKFWDDGNPMWQLVVTLQTDVRDPALPDDDGQRRLFVKANMKAAVSEAVREAGAEGLEIGGILSVTYTHDGQPKARGFSPPKFYSARYVPAATAELHTPDPGTAPAPTAAPPAAAPPAPVVQLPPGITQEQLLAALAAQQQNPARLPQF